MNRFVDRAARVLLSASLLVTPALAADTYKIIHPFAAGGAADVLARMLAYNMGTAMGASFTVENIGGANGNIGASKVASALF